MLRIALAQIDPIVGAFEGNVEKIRNAYVKACAAGARFLVTPELGVCGYPTYDLLERPDVFERHDRALEDLSALTRGQSCALIVGHVARNDSQQGRAAQNVASVFENGLKVFSQAKTLLPAYDVFDESRYFEPAKNIQPWICDGQRIALAICEDLWGCDSRLSRRLYGQDPVAIYQEQKVQLVISISASPYEWKKRQRRHAIHQSVVQRLKVPLAYVNQVGATDELVFDGDSFILDASGTLCGRMPRFECAVAIAHLSSSDCSLDCSTDCSKDSAQKPPEQLTGVVELQTELEGLEKALVTGIREYFQRTGFQRAIIGLSGGIDSAVVAVLAARALGSKNLLGIAMPSQYSSTHSLEDAQILANNLGCRFEVRPIKFIFSTFSRELAEGLGQLAPIALENLQSRLRGTLLMTRSNHENSLVLTTGNKSELAMGYCTLYGDLVGALAPIGDLFKTRVYELAHYLNEICGACIPQRSLLKPPSAELRPNQTDQDSLPPYALLDELLAEWIEIGTLSAADLEARYEERLKPSQHSVRKILRCVDANEYKRRQAPPIIKISAKAFGIGRRVPLVQKWEV